jgi:hypothetical protein
MTRIIFVVSRNHVELAAQLAFEGLAGTAEVIVDRRQNDNRQSSLPIDFPDRRHLQRRVTPTARELDLIGVAVVLA